MYPFIRPFTWVITLLITSRGPPCSLPGEYLLRLGVLVLGLFRASSHDIFSVSVFGCLVTLFFSWLGGGVIFGGLDYWTHLFL